MSDADRQLIDRIVNGTNNADPLADIKDLADGIDEPILMAIIKNLDTLVVGLLKKNLSISFSKTSEHGGADLGLYVTYNGHTISNSTIRLGL